MPQIAPTRALVAMAGGLGLQAVNLAFHLPRGAEVAVGFASGALLVHGCSIAAHAKGYTRWLGFAGLLSFLGVGVLLLVPGPQHYRFFRWFRARETSDGE